MEAEEKNGCRLIIFYDCCIPRAQFAAILPSKIKQAKHFFVRDLFGESVCRSDYKLFSRVDALRRKYYPFSQCVFVTQDQKFSDEVCDHPALNTTIRLLTIVSCNSPRQNFHRAAELAKQLFSEYAALWEEKKSS